MRIKKIFTAALAACVLTLNISVMAETSSEETTVEYIPISATEPTKIEAESVKEFDGTITGGIVSFTMGKVLSYNINIPEDGYYDFSLYQGAIASGVVELQIDDTLKLVGDTVVTGDYNVYNTASLGAVKMTAGEYKLTLVAKGNMQLDYLTITKTIPTRFKLQAELNDGTNAGTTATSTKTATLHNANQYIDWKVNIEKAGVYEFTLNAYGYNNPSKPIIKINGETAINCGEITADATACVKHNVGSYIFEEGEYTITLYNPAGKTETGENISSSMFVDWLEVNMVSGIMQISATEPTKIEAEEDGRFDGKVTDGIVSFTMGKVLTYNVSVAEEGYYDISLYQGAIASGVVEVQIDDVLKLVGDVAVTGDYDVYDTKSLGAIKMTAGDYELKLVAKTNMQLDYLTITKTIPTNFRLQAEINDGTNAGTTATSTKTATLHNANQYIDWNVNIEKAGVYEFVLNAYGYNNPSKPIIKINGETAIDCEEITADATACVKHNVGSYIFEEGEYTITLYNPAGKTETGENISSSMFVDWLEINRVSGITKFRLECENADEQSGGKADGSTRWTLYNSNSYVLWNIDIEETGVYKFSINANGYLNTAKPVIYVNDTAAAYSVEILPSGFDTYEMGTYGMKAGSYTIKLLNPSNSSFKEGWTSANMFADYVEIERISGLTGDVLEFEKADSSDFKGATQTAKDVALYNTGTWAEWNVNVAGGEYEFVLNAGTAALDKIGKPVLFVDGKAVAQGTVASTSWAKVDTTICKIYLSEGNHTIKVYNPQNAGTGENKDAEGNALYESSVAMSADKLTINKVSDAGLLTPKKAGMVTAKANVTGYEKAILIAAEYSGEDIVSLDICSDAVNGELEVKLDVTSSSNNLRLFLWDGTNTMLPHIAAKVY